MKYSIIIPTYNHCNDLLKPCIDSIIKNTIWDGEKELIVVANGCTDNTKEYLNNLPIPITILWSDIPLGYTISTNAGLKEATGDYIILMNNDVSLLDWANNDNWLITLKEPFKDQIVGVVGPHALWHKTEYFLVFFLVMISRKCFNDVGLLDERFNPGAGEDTDFCIRAKLKGYKIIKICEGKTSKDTTYPVFHKGEGTMHDPNCMQNWNEIFARNNDKLNKKWNL